MGGEWRETTVGELIARDGGSIKTGPFGTVLKAHEYSRDGVPLISVGEVGYGSLRVHDKTPRAPREVVERLPDYLLEAGDIVFGRKGAVDRSAIVKAEQQGWFLGSDGIRLRLPRTCNARFVAYQLQTREAREWLLQHATGSTMASLNQAIIERIPLVLPSISDQDRLVGIVGCLDEKIELNRRMCETLEAMARALFKSWFVDFDPVRAKAEGRDSGLPAEIAELFPEGFEESEHGEIPRGWTVGSILDQAHLLSGGTPKTDRSDYWDGPIHWASAKDVSQCATSFLISTERTITGLGLAESATQLIPAFATVIVARGATTGRMVLFGREMAMNQTCYALVSRTETPIALYCLVRETIGALVHAAHGSVFDTITTRTFAESSLVLPPTRLLRAFEDLCESYFHRMLICIEESQAMAQQRDLLLPRLLRGDLPGDAVWMDAGQAS